MNSNILKKCIDELQKDKPRLEYILGLLESLYEIGEPVKYLNKYNPENSFSNPIMVTNATKIGEIKDEGKLMDLEAKAKLESVKKMIKLE